MIPIKDKNIIVGVKYKEKFKWYLTPKVLWVFNLNTLNPGERIKYAKEIIDYRKDLNVINKLNISTFLNNISELKTDTFTLKNSMSAMLQHDDRFIEDFLPALYVDFDQKVYYAHCENIDYYKTSITADFTFVDEDFLEHINSEYYYWQ